MVVGYRGLECAGLLLGLLVVVLEVQVQAQVQVQYYTIAGKN